jgi:hypothetical protein
MSGSRATATAVLGLRVAYGAALMAAPRRLTLRWLGPGATQYRGGVVALRALGMREALLHAGAIAALWRGEPLRPWLAASIGGDVGDIAWTAAARSSLPDGSAPVTAGVAGGSALLTLLVGALAER